MSDWKPFATALLGSWPSQVAGWGREALAAYVSELEARGVTPDQAIAAVRMSDTAFPPSAAEIATAARRDPSRPTFTEAYRMIYGPRGVMFARRGEELDRAFELHPLLGAFCRAYGVSRLRMLEVDHEEYGELRRRELGQEWDRFTEASEQRSAAQLAAPRRGEIGKFDPLAALGGGSAQVPATVGEERGED